MSDFGVEYTVLEYQTLIAHRPLSGPVQYLPGLKRLALDDGSAVNFIDAKTFKIVDSGVLIRVI